MVMLDKSKASDVTAYTDRRLHPVRLGIGHLNRLLAANKGSATITTDRALLESVTATLEIFVEDFELSFGSKEDKKKTGSPAEASRVSQTRVS